MSCECPICLNNIDTVSNCVTTECGHTFHCSCLLQNAAHNGFGCPYCRTSLAEEVVEEEDDEDEDEEDEDWIEEDEETFQEFTLETFRMFHQRLNGEEVEDGTEIREETPYPDLPEDYDETISNGFPNAEYVSRMLLERGISHKDLVKSLLAIEHDDLLEGWGIMYRNKSSQVYGKIRAIIHQRTRNNR